MTENSAKSATERGRGREKREREKGVRKTSTSHLWPCSLKIFFREMEMGELVVRRAQDAGAGVPEEEKGKGRFWNRSVTTLYHFT